LESALKAGAESAALACFVEGLTGKGLTLSARPAFLDVCAEAMPTVKTIKVKSRN
jgi:hypothetical protein